MSPYHAHEVVVQSAAGGNQPVDDEVAKLEKALGINLKNGGGGGNGGEAAVWRCVFGGGS